MMRRNIKKNKKLLWAFLLAGAFIALFLAFFLKALPPRFVTKSALFLAQPLISVKNKVAVFVEHNSSVFKEKRGLKDENISLKQKILELQTKQKFVNALLEENKRLKSVFSFDEKRSLVIASIISRPGYGIYNALVIDAGSKEGVEEGMIVTAFGNVLLGYVVDVMPNISRVKLVSYPEEETNVFIGGRVSAIAVGLGGENMEVALPNDLSIKVGDNITTFGVNSLFLGIVEEIIKSPADPFQKIIFRLPLNIQELRFVYLIK
jgi:rod shape-determining protein MreC